MISQEIKSCCAALGELTHELTDEQAELVRRVRHNLSAAAEDAEVMEANPMLMCDSGLKRFSHALSALNKINREVSHG